MLTVKSPLNSQVQTSFAVFIYSISFLTNQSINGISIAPPPYKTWTSTSRFIPSATASPFSSRFTSSSTSQLISDIIHTLVIHHSFTPGSKPIFSTNPFHRRFLLPTGLPHDNGTGPDLSRSSFYFLVLHFNFLFRVVD